MQCITSCDQYVPDHHCKHQRKVRALIKFKRLQIEMTIDLYYMPESAPCRAIQMTAAAVGVELNLKHLDLFAKEHLKPEFIAINPQHTIPTLVDNGLVLTESRAICAYLVERYGKPDDDLYPRDPVRRARVNQRLFFDMGTMYDTFAKCYYPLLQGTATDVDPEAYKKIEFVMELLNGFLEGESFVADSKLTIADISLLASVTSFVHADMAFDMGTKYPNVTRWLTECKQVTPGYEHNEAGVQKCRTYMNAGLKKNHV